jgi:hypothetical protein
MVDRNVLFRRTHPYRIAIKIDFIFKNVTLNMI